MLIHVDKGLEFQKLGKYDEAMECYDKALEIDPRNIVAYMNKGSTLFHLGNPSAALECFNIVIDIDPKIIDCISIKQYYS